MIPGKTSPNGSKFNNMVNNCSIFNLLAQSVFEIVLYSSMVNNSSFGHNFIYRSDNLAQVKMQIHLIWRDCGFLEKTQRRVVDIWKQNISAFSH
jgi:hypothetical protein